MYQEMYSADDIGRDNDDRKLVIREKLSSEIEYFLKNNQNYSGEKGRFSPSDYALFWGIRTNYWRNRCFSEGGCDLINDIDNLIKYHDLNHKDLSIEKFSFSRMDWTSTILDFLSIPLSVIAANSAPQSVKQILLNTAANTTDLVTTAKSFYKNDKESGWIGIGSFLPGPIGFFFSIISLERDFNEGYYSVPFSSPLHR